MKDVFAEHGVHFSRGSPSSGLCLIQQASRQSLPVFTSLSHCHEDVHRYMWAHAGRVLSASYCHVYDDILTLASEGERLPSCYMLQFIVKYGVKTKEEQLIVVKLSNLEYIFHYL